MGSLFRRERQICEDRGADAAARSSEIGNSTPQPPPPPPTLLLNLLLLFPSLRLLPDPEPRLERARIPERRPPRRRAPCLTRRSRVASLPPACTAAGRQLAAPRAQQASRSARPSAPSPSHMRITHNRQRLSSSGGSFASQCCFAENTGYSWQWHMRVVGGEVLLEVLSRLLRPAGESAEEAESEAVGVRC
jgi:hypothetical protein